MWEKAAKSSCRSGRDEIMAGWNHKLASSAGHCSVPCLFGIIELQQECEKRAVKLSEETRKYLLYQMLRKLGHSQSQKLISKFVDQDIQDWKVDFDVESILDDYRDQRDNQVYYLIKWVGWGHEHNTWEPEQNLHCKELLRGYEKVKRGWHRKRILSHTKQEDPCGIKRHRIDELFQKLMESKIFDSLSPLDMLKNYNPDKKTTHVNGLIQPKLLRLKKIPKKLHHQEVIRALRIWQDELNSIIKGYDPAPIYVENTVDLEGPPENFIYINERKEGPEVHIPKDPLIGCDCNNCYLDRKSCCAVASGSVLAYYKSNGRLRVPRGVPIYECNIRCTCGPDCLNRVVQKGRKFKICIFRTPNGRGWGVKTLQNIKRGAFVMEYVGEVITNEEAERRGQDYDAVGRTYLFDLDFHDADAPFAVDAGTHGNAAHFINHSCSPNLEVHVVWINTLDPQLPHICLYAKRDIVCNEELTFDYMGGNLTHESPLPDQADCCDLPCQTEAVSNGQAVVPLCAQSLETSGRRLLEVEAGADGKSETQSIQDVWDQGTFESLAGARPNGIVLHKLCDLAVPDAESAADMTGGSAPAESDMSKFSMACLCGASTCRKFLFF